MLNKLTEPCIFVDEISNIAINRSYFKNINKNFSSQQIFQWSPQGFMVETLHLLVVNLWSNSNSVEPKNDIHQNIILKIIH